VDPHCFDADPDPDPAQNLAADPDPDPDPGGGGWERVGQPKMCIPPGKILGTPLDMADCGQDLADWSERLTANAKVATVLDSIPASSGTVDSEGRQGKQG
jgi:hypothetical protein